MKDLDLTTLRYFVAVCETGNISRAAELQHVVPSAISKRLAQIESEFGVPLLQRQRRGVAPTPAGENLLEHSRAILSSAQKVAQDMVSFGTGLRGKVRLLATVSSIAESLPDDVAAFLQKPEHREIQVEIEEDVSREVVRRVKEGGASLGVLWDATNLDGLKSVPYRTDHLAVVAHAAHPLARRKRCSFQETLDFEHVGMEPSSAVNVMLSRAAAVAGKQMIYRAQVSTFEAALRVVRANLGISILPKEIASSYAQAFGIKVVPLQDGWARRRFNICYRDKDVLTRAATMLLDHLSAVANG